MKKILFFIFVVAMMVSCKDGVLVNRIDKNVNVAVGGNVVSKDTIVVSVSGATFNMIGVEGGTFQMGSENGGSDEQPVRSVTLSKYYIGETEVTQQLWKAVMGTTVSQQRDKANTSWPLRGEGDDYPMYYVSWNECQEFIGKLNEMTGKTFALPTEAQWEYAARGGNKSRGYTYSGSNNVDDVAWYNGNSSNLTHLAGLKQTNELGLYDMSGNVYEWCSDWYDKDCYSNSPSTDPTGPTSGSRRVLRGGSWSSDASRCRSAFRIGSYPDSRYDDYGLRLVLLF